MLPSRGLWFIDFASNQKSFGSGVVVISWPHILGGDSAYTYTGTGHQHDDEIEVQIRVEHYGKLPPWTVFNVAATEFNILAHGKVEAVDELWLVGNVAEYPLHEIHLNLKLKHRLI